MAERVTERVALGTIAALSLAVVLAVALATMGPSSAPPGAASASRLPGVNATLNGISAVLLAVGYWCIRRRRVAAHRAAMLGAFASSSCFLVTYLVYHAQVGSVRFTGEGVIRPVYFFLLVTHILLATLIVPLALTTIYRAWTAQLARHRAIARVTLPLWLYVSVTGVVIYWMLHRL